MSIKEQPEKKASEIVIVGAGLAGLFAALKMSPLPVTVVTAAPLGEGASSSWAQAGIAAALEEGDTHFAHALDTVNAGAGIVNAHMAHILASEASKRIEDLLAYGAPFDRNLEGGLLLSREAAHSARRVVRVKGDRAGLAIMKALISAARAKPNINIIEGYVAKQLEVRANRVRGVHVWSLAGEHMFLPSRAIVLATGGVGGLYRLTTNPRQANGEALAMAARAGAILADTEFVQFHPTAINTDIDPAPLATEALRGDGATLIDSKGKRFMPAIHEDAELAPRDIVARAVFAQNVSGDGAFLDCREAIGDEFAQMFPSVYEKCQEAGIDPLTEPIPVAPAAHFHMGGVFTDAYGRTSVDGLWACGEVASTGAHGANRLASNSLLEAVVFAARVAKDLAASNVVTMKVRSKPEKTSHPERKYEIVLDDSDEKVVQEIRELMDRYVGIERNEQGMQKALKQLCGLEKKHARHLTLRNMLIAARIITVSALLRKESRGGHYRTDYPQSDIKLAQRSKFTFARINEASRELLASSPKGSVKTSSGKNAKKRSG